MRTNEKLVIKRTSPRLTSGKSSQKLDEVRDKARKMSRYIERNDPFSGENAKWQVD